MSELPDWVWLLLRDVADPEPCRIDRNGDCQEHLRFPNSKEYDNMCPHWRVKINIPWQFVGKDWK